MTGGPGPAPRPPGTWALALGPGQHRGPLAAAPRTTKTQKQLELGLRVCPHTQHGNEPLEMLQSGNQLNL